ncbi:hypothetical protein PPL_05320 [Heterostelium album PN500]|uniref:Uncharacterized protein n=1 Tax=Heterostelium pallidum (strain ATCC 26659 / Pp 5 / PN500) TaxID=670386 RepID=D3BBD0_HETP5|nr:hypothetical protein PPL_05320 [Heterostelium album PN500]EFA81337.1 hypothetical protein PPL_05320 [Heterostelium album PN500]|eukprot:XP_020433455.1 hypothetical protein PPL_05320 [Heterostelium album PN500]
MNSMYRAFNSRVLSSTVPNLTQKFSTQSRMPEFAMKNAKLSSAAMIHKSCFNTSRVEQTLLEEVGEGQADPSFNPSPS